MASVCVRACLVFRIWDLSDIDQDGFLDASEFAIAVYLIKQAQTQTQTQTTGLAPATLAPEIVPPSKR
jgi:hypothetical protein